MGGQDLTLLTLGKGFRESRTREPQHYPETNPPGIQHRVSQGPCGVLGSGEGTSVIKVLMDVLIHRSTHLSMVLMRGEETALPPPSLTQV